MSETERLNGISKCLKPLRDLFEDILKEVHQASQSDADEDSLWVSSLRSLGSLSLPVERSVGFAMSVEWEEGPAPAEPDLPVAVASPQADRTFPESDSQSVARELGLESLCTREALEQARRDFVRRNHPDKVQEHFKEIATRRTSVANALIDQALKLLGS